MLWRIDTTPIASTHYFNIERIQGEAIVCFIKNTFYFVSDSSFNRSPHFLSLYYCSQTLDLIIYFMYYVISINIYES